MQQAQASSSLVWTWAIVCLPGWEVYNALSVVRIQVEARRPFEVGSIYTPPKELVDVGTLVWAERTPRELFMLDGWFHSLAEAKSSMEDAALTRPWDHLLEGEIDLTDFPDDAITVGDC